MVVGERYRADGSVREHPFHQCDRGIFAYQSLEQHKIKRETELCQQAEQVTPYIAAFTATGRCALTAQNQQQGSGCPDKDTDYLFR